MKLVGFYLVLFFVSLQSTRSQDSIHVNKTDTTHKKYKVALRTWEQEKTFGYLMAIEDSSVYLHPLGGHPEPFHKSTLNLYNHTEWDAYKYREIESIKVRHPAVKIIAIIAGFVAGSIAGTIIGADHTTVNDLEQIYQPINNGAIGFLIGGILGAGAGWAVSSAFEKKYMINGDWKTLQEVKATLKY